MLQRSCNTIARSEGSEPAALRIISRAQHVQAMMATHCAACGPDTEAGTSAALLSHGQLSP